MWLLSSVWKPFVRLSPKARMRNTSTPARGVQNDNLQQLIDCDFDFNILVVLIILLYLFSVTTNNLNRSLTKTITCPYFTNISSLRLATCNHVNAIFGKSRAVFVTQLIFHVDVTCVRHVIDPCPVLALLLLQSDVEIFFSLFRRRNLAL